MVFHSTRNSFAHAHVTHAQVRAHTNHTQSCPTTMQFDSTLPDSLKCQPQVSVRVRRQILYACACMCLCVCKHVCVLVREAEKEGALEKRRRVRLQASLYSWLSAVETEGSRRPCFPANAPEPLEVRTLESRWMGRVNGSKHQNTEQAPALPLRALN